MDLDDLVDKFVSGKSLEGDSGCETLTELVEAMGYTHSGFRFGDPIERFLSDNPGAIEVLVNWISEQRIDEWAEALSGVEGAEALEGEDE